MSSPWEAWERALVELLFAAPPGVQALPKASQRAALGAAARRLSGAPFLAVRFRCTARSALGGQSPVEHLVAAAERSRDADDDADGWSLGSGLLRVAGALMATAGCTPRELRRLLELATPAPGPRLPAAREAIRAARRAFAGCVARRRRRGPCRGAYFDVRPGGAVEVPTLPWPLQPPNKEYGLSLWARVASPPAKGARVELARLAKTGAGRGRGISKGSDLGRFPLVSADFWTSDRPSRSVDAFPVEDRAERPL